VVVPVKALSGSKQRLAPVLGPRRTAFARALLVQTLFALVGARRVSGVLVVTSDTEVADEARQIGAEVVQAEADLNTACTLGIAELHAHGADLCAILHADLARLSPRAVDALIYAYADHRSALGDGAVGLVRCHEGTGTNAALFDPRLPFTPAFGLQSFAAHWGALGGRAVEIRSDEVAFDVDTEEDMAKLARGFVPARLQAFVGAGDLTGANQGQEFVAGAPASAGSTASTASAAATASVASASDVLARAAAPPSTASARAAEAASTCSAAAPTTVPTLDVPASALSALAFAGDAFALIDAPLEALVARASALRDAGHDGLVTYSRKVFLPLTHLCRDTCHYCTFAKTPRHLGNIYMSVDEAVATAAAGAKCGCKEALFTLGEKPELRYNAAEKWLAENGFKSTLHYVAHVAAVVRDKTGLLPHINAGCMTAEEMAMLRPVSASMGLMLESASERLCAKGNPHYGSPDKVPAARLQAIAEAGRQRVPFTSGILIGIGETRAERIEALLAIRDLHERYGHIQEIIIQNFQPKPGTRMAKVAAPPLDELVWTIAVARILFGPRMNIQAPPNLNPGVLGRLIDAGVNDWGGVSPLTPDYVNPEAPWPEIERLGKETAMAGKILAERLTIYPAYAREPEMWLDTAMRSAVLEVSDTGGRGREDLWRAGRSIDAPPSHYITGAGETSTGLTNLLDVINADGADDLSVDEVARLFEARADEYVALCEAADRLRAATVGDVATYVVNRNINYTNICTYGCGFCAFSKGKRKQAGAEKPYLLDMEEIGSRVSEAWARGGTEVCLQGGIHPTFTGNTYIEIVRAVKRAVPAMHVHAFSPLEIRHGATTLGLSIRAYLSILRDEGLGSLPGTAAEILDDTVRQVLCPDKLNTGQWLAVIEAAHDVGLRTTATIMFGHVDDYRAWAKHLLAIRDLQKRTGGFTEFVPLAFVAHEAPLYKLGRARPGPTFREGVLMHAVARLVLYPYITHVQASWVKMGRAGMLAALRSGADDLGGTLMNESITRAAGAIHGQETTATGMREIADTLGRVLMRRSTLYATNADAQLSATSKTNVRKLVECQENPPVEA
jgi:FO synthase